jgi:hypothetical protein
MDCSKYYPKIKVPSVINKNYTRKLELETREKYKKDQDRLYKKFKRDLFKALNIQDNPKREIFYTKIFQIADKYGFQEMYNYAKHLVELINDEEK